MTGMLATRRSRLIVLLNDNDLSLAPPVGAMSANLSRLISSKPSASMRHLAKEVASRFEHYDLVSAPVVGGALYWTSENSRAFPMSMLPCSGKKRR